MKTESMKRSLEKIKERFRKQEEERERHKREVEEMFGTSGNPKADLLYRISWDFGHSSGLREVEYYYMEMLDLVK